MTKGTAPYHPRQCHLCKYNGVNVRLKAEGKPLDEQAARACLSCQAVKMEQVHDGLSWVSLDAAENPATVYMGRLAPDYAPNAKVRHAESVTGDRRDGLLDIIRRFGGIPFGCADVVCGMLAGKTLADMAKESGKSIQVLHGAWKRACAKDPIWRAIENGMMGKGVGRKKKTLDQEAQEEPKQMELL